MKKVKVGKSKIHGNGLFADEPIRRGEVIELVHTIREIEPGVIKTTPTLLGRNYNHSEDANALNVVDGNNRYLVALKEIEAGGEITTNYKNNPDLEQPDSFSTNDNYISFDYDDTLTTPEGFKLAQQMNKEGKNLYIITARDKITPQMIERAEAAGIPKENIIPAGSDQEKVRIIKENNINKHIDNKDSVIKALGDKGELFSPDAYPDLKADFIEMDLSEEDLNKLKEGGFVVEEYANGGQTTSKQIGPTYYYPGRIGSEYKLNDSGQWTIKNSSTHGKFVPIKDPNGTRSKELDRNALDSAEYASYKKRLESQIKNPKAPQMYIKDTRTVRATSGQPINPNVDLKSSNYNQEVITNIVKRAKAYGVDPSIAVAVAMQESMLGKTDTNLGHNLYSSGDPYSYIPYLKQSMAKGKDQYGYDDIYRQLQVYNGLGVITPNTEKNYHGYQMAKIYGVPIPSGGINMKENPLYGKEIMDIRDNVLMQNPEFVKLVKQTKPARFANGGDYKTKLNKFIR